MTHNANIGRIISINYREIVVETLQSVGEYICTDDGVRFIGEIGSYIAIDDLGRRIISEITSVDGRDMTSSLEYSQAKNDRFLKLSPIGEIIDGVFSFGIRKMPPMFAEVDLITEKDLQIMMNVVNSEIIEDDEFTKLVAFPIGSSVIFPQYDVKVRLNEFFGFHFAVLGNTGSGKSNTIAHMIQTIFSKKHYSARGANFIIFDSNGEYERAFSKIEEINPEISVKFLSTDIDGEGILTMPVWALGVDDWAVLLRASEKTQVPVISKALDFIKIFSSNNNSNDIMTVKNGIIAHVINSILSSSESSASKSDKMKSILGKYETAGFASHIEIDVERNEDANCKKERVSISTAISIDYGTILAPRSLMKYCQKFIDSYSDSWNFKKDNIVTYSLEEFKEAIDFAILYEGSVTSNRIFEYAAPLLTRIQHLIESDHGRFLDKTEYTTISDYMESIIGDNQILNIDISSLDNTATEVVTKVFSKMLFDYVRKDIPRNSKPINLILEEAHRFVKNKEDYGVLGYNIFERIAKEGRKYGLLLGISSQRPSELSNTVVSQCSNFIIHRLQNPDDLHYISSMVPYVNRSIIERISYLPRGDALVFGTSINLPMLTSFEQANPMPDSSNPDITGIWYI